MQPQGFGDELPAEVSLHVTDKYLEGRSVNTQLAI